MKFVKKLFIMFVFSFLIATSGVKAYISSVVNLANFNLPVTKTTAVISNKVKNDMDSQVLKLTFVTLNRNIQFRMYDSNIGYSTDNFTTLSYNGGTNVFELNSSLYANNTLAASILYPGTKKIELRTALYFLDTTSISGTWYLSKNDYLS